MSGMTVLVAGASGATGSRLVGQLLERGCEVRAIARNPEAVRAKFAGVASLTLIHGSILEIPESQLAEYAKGCAAIASCLGHTMTVKGLFGKPRFLVADAVKRLCAAAKANHPAEKVRFVLMNTTANANKDLDEPRTVPERIVFFLLGLLLPPHADNVRAAEYLRASVGKNDGTIEWAAVRPDSLYDAEEVTSYRVVPSPERSPVFDSGTTSRINAAHFMAELVADGAAWEKWKGRMPVVYDAVPHVNGGKS